MNKAADKLIWSAEEILNFKESDDDHLIKGLLKKSEAQTLVATAKTGKSLLTLNLAIDFAEGDEFLETFPTKGGRVLLLQTEISPTELSKRLQTMIGSMTDKVKSNLLFSFARVKLENQRGIDTLLAIIDTSKPDLIILDPFYTLHNADENSAKDMSRVLTQLKVIVTNRNIGCIVVHHQGKAGEGNSKTQPGFHSRGSSAIADVPDGTWALVKDRKSQIATLQFELRNTQSPDPMNISLGEDLWWKKIDHINVNLKADDTVKLVAKIVQENNPIDNQTLISRFCEVTGKSAKTAQTRIAEANLNNLIIKNKEGQKVIWKSNYPKGNP